MALQVDKEIISLIAGVIDESVSMKNVHEETVSGYNAYVMDIQKEQAGKTAYVSTYLFDDHPGQPHLRTVCDATPLADYVPLTTETYCPRGFTPLYDAVCMAILSIDKAVAEKGINKVTLLIQTDGQENRSTEYDHAKTTQMIKERTEAGWLVVFLGADLANAKGIGMSLGVSAANSMFYSKSKSAETFSAMSAGTRSYRGAADASTEITLSDEDKKKFS